MNLLNASESTQDELAAFVIGVPVHADCRTTASIQGIADRIPAAYRPYFDAGLAAARRVWR